MSKLFRSRNALILVILIVITAVVAVLGLVTRSNTPPVSVTVNAVDLENAVVELPAIPQPIPADLGGHRLIDWLFPAACAEEDESSSAAPQLAYDAYALVIFQGLPQGQNMQLLPLPPTDEGAYTFPLEQFDMAGNSYVNMLRVTSDSIWMESANCEGQDCIGEGVVTL